MNNLIVQLDEATLDDLADRIAARMGGALMNQPSNLKQAAKAIGVSTETIRVRVNAGLIAKIPGLGKRILIPRSEMERLQKGESKP